LDSFAQLQTSWVPIAMAEGSFHGGRVAPGNAKSSDNASFRVASTIQTDVAMARFSHLLVLFAEVHCRIHASACLDGVVNGLRILDKSHVDGHSEEAFHVDLPDRRRVKAGTHDDTHSIGQAQTLLQFILLAALLAFLYLFSMPPI
jgi:hypothetical protein